MPIWVVSRFSLRAGVACKADVQDEFIDLEVGALSPGRTLEDELRVVSAGAAQRHQGCDTAITTGIHLSVQA